jgi:hypothetical protein
LTVELEVFEKLFKVEVRQLKLVIGLQRGHGCGEAMGSGCGAASGVPSFWPSIK